MNKNALMVELLGHLRRKAANASFPEVMEAIVLLDGLGWEGDDLPEPAPADERVVLEQVAAGLSMPSNKLAELMDRLQAADHGQAVNVLQQGLKDGTMVAAPSGQIREVPRDKPGCC